MLMLTGDRCRLVVADVAIESFKFRLVVVCAQYRCGEDFLFTNDTKRLVLMDDWNAILDPKIDKFGRRARWTGRFDSSLIGLMTRHDLVDRFRLDYPGQEM